MTGNSERRDVVVVGASAGGVEALKALACGLPPDLPAAIFVVLHLPRNGPSALAPILARSGPLTATTAADGVVPRLGQIYVAPPDHHLVFHDRRIWLSRGPAENGHRPAVDTMFRSAARAHRRRVIGVVLSGSRDDGAAGLLTISRAGGAALVQDPLDALYPSMPRAALASVPGASTAPANAIGSMLGDLCRRAPDPSSADGSPGDGDLAELTPATADLTAPSAGFGCPSCGGSLFELATLPVPRFRCRVGHAWSAGTLLEEQSGAMESALWTALRALQEKAELTRRLAAAGGSRGTSRSASRYDALAEESRRAGVLIRGLIDSIGAAGLHETPASID